MSEDLYTKILNLPEGERPPHFYDLLAIDLFESDGNKIHSAGLQQMKTLREWQLHPDQSIANSVLDILSHVSTACTTLEVLARKEDYDQQLAEKLGIDLSQEESYQILTAETELRECPICGAKMSDIAILCIECGYNLETGIKMVDWKYWDDSLKKSEVEKVEDSRKKRKQNLIGLILFCILIICLIRPVINITQVIQRKIECMNKNITIPDLEMEFVWVPEMKCWVGQCEVTNGAYKIFEPGHKCGEYKFNKEPAVNLNKDWRPVVNVNFDDAVAFAEWLTEREKKSGRLPQGVRYQLPDGEEWTTFAKCGDRRKYPWGDNWPPKNENYCGQENSEGSIPSYTDYYRASCAVINSGKNDWGLYGVGGNVWEWTSETDSDGERFIRGGSWRTYNEEHLTCDYRHKTSDKRRDDVGFRLILR